VPVADFAAPQTKEQNFVNAPITSADVNPKKASEAHEPQSNVPRASPVSQLTDHQIADQPTNGRQPVHVKQSVTVVKKMSVNQAPRI